MSAIGKNMSRPKWDEIWISLALHVSQRSPDTRLKVGCVVVTEDNSSVLSLGYNGDQHGGANKPDSMEPGKSGFIHAEANALIKMNFADHRQKKIYLTHSPCSVCARMIVNAGIKKVIYCDEYRDTKGVDILKDSGIVVEKYEMYMAN
jgi:dCMP deaminase